MKNKMLIYDEIFTSIQGEGTNTGLPTCFIRLYGCNYKCEYCDTPQGDKPKKRISVENVIRKIFKSGVRNVCITGGEPLLQPEVYCLVYELVEAGYNVSIETNGGILITDDRSIRGYKFVLDIKTPSSGMSAKNKYENLEILLSHDEVKFVIADKNDYNFAKDVLRKYPTKAQILFSPMFDVEGKQNIGKDLSEWIIKDRLNARLQIQMHTVLGLK